MDQETLEDCKKELRAHLAKMLAFPSQDWRREGERVVVLREMIAAAEGHRVAA